jgi:hypothetical protein
LAAVKFTLSSVVQTYTQHLVSLKTISRSLIIDEAGEISQKRLITFSSLCLSCTRKHVLFTFHSAKTPHGHLKRMRAEKQQRELPVATQQQHSSKNSREVESGQRNPLKSPLHICL